MSGGFWGVAIIAGAIAAIALARSTFSVSLGMALVVLLLLGSLFPPAGLLLGGVALFYLFYVHGQELLSRFQASIGGK